MSKAKAKPKQNANTNDDATRERDEKVAAIMAAPSWEACAQVLGVSGKGTLRPWIRANLRVYRSKDATDAQIRAAKDAIVAKWIDGKNTSDAREVYFQAIERAKQNDAQNA